MTPVATIQSLYDEYAHSLTNYACRLVPGYQRANAEDAVQETFVCAITHLQSGKPIDAPLGFLMTTLRNVIASTFYRGRCNTLTDDYSDMSDLTEMSRRLCTDYKVDINQRLAVFQAAIEAIPNPHHREAFVRKRIYGQSAAEIADAMGFQRENTVYNYASFGWKSLREYLEQHGYSADNFFEEAA